MKTNNETSPQTHMRYPLIAIITAIFVIVFVLMYGTSHKTTSTASNPPEPKTVFVTNVVTVTETTHAVATNAEHNVQQVAETTEPTNTGLHVRIKAFAWAKKQPGPQNAGQTNQQ